MILHHILTAASLVVTVAATISQQMCYDLAYGPAGQCNAASTDSEYLETFLVQDHITSNCAAGGVFRAVAGYVDTNGVSSTASALNTVSISNSYIGPLLFSYNIPVSTIGSNHPVKVTVLATNTQPAGTLSRVVSFTLGHSPTVSYLSETTTATSTYAVTTTSTFVFTNIRTTTYTPTSRRTVTNIGYTTALAPRPTTTSTYTLTPLVRTIVSLNIIPQVTTTLTCNPTLRPSTSIARREALPTAFRVPYCAAPVTTTLTARSIQVFNTTTWYTTTTLSTFTSTLTELASSPTVFLSPTRTQTITPRVATSKVATILPRPTIYINSTILFTSTKYQNGGKTKVCTQPTPTIDLLATARISNSGSTASTSRKESTKTSITTTVTSTSFLATGSAYTSTISGKDTKTIIIGYAQTYSTVYHTSGTVQRTTTLATPSGTRAGTVEVIYPTPDLSCTNQGLEYAMYNNSFYNSNLAYSAFDVSFFRTATPYFTGSTSRMGIGNTGPNTITRVYDDSPSIYLPYLAINHRGFLWARSTGTYTFTCPFSDDITFFWIGSNAISNWTRANSQLEQNYAGGTSTRSFTMHLDQGQYYPFRVLFGNGQGYAGFSFNMIGPDGVTIESGTGSSSDYIVKFACDSSTPTFPAFGSSG